MPVETEYLEDGIILTRWLDEVIMDDLFASQKRGLALADEHDMDVYVVIIDLTQGNMRDFDFAGFRRLIGNPDEKIISTVIFGASSAARFAGRTIGSITGLNAVFCNDLDTSLTEARRILAQHKG